jgi:hypothetical protein
MEGDFSKNPSQTRTVFSVNALNSGKWRQKEGPICLQYGEASGLSNQLSQTTARNRFSPEL